MDRKHISKSTIVLACIFIGISGIFSACKTPAPVSGNHSGNLAPDITASDAAGNSIELNSLHGKLVLIEFWDSNNSAARKNHYEMQRMYQKYGNTSFEGGNGFAIYSISIDTDTEKWKQAIAADDIHFTAMVNDTKAWNSKAVLDYDVASLPKYFLLDKNGIIINHNILIPDLEKILQDLED